MIEIGTRKQVLCKKAKQTKQGKNYDTLIAENPKFASIAKRSAGAQSSKWREHVLNYAKKHKLTYGAALSHPNCKKTYTKVTPKPKKSDTSATPPSTNPPTSST